jgi:hypothetical protein
MVRAPNVSQGENGLQTNQCCVNVRVSATIITYLFTNSPCFARKPNFLEQSFKHLQRCFLCLPALRSCQGRSTAYTEREPAKDTQALARFLA